MTRKRKMKHTLQAIFVGLAFAVATLGIFSMVGCRAIESGLSAVEWSPQQRAEAEARFEQRLLDGQAAVDRGEMSPEELARLMRDSLIGFGADMSTAIVQNAVSALEGKLSTSSQGAGAAGGLVGMLASVIGYVVRERSWKRKREPALVEKVNK
jgi:hypothetical protein